MTESGIKTTTQIKIIMSKYIYIHTQAYTLKWCEGHWEKRKRKMRERGRSRGIAGSGEQGKKKGENVCGSLVGQLANQIWSVSHEILGEYSIFLWEHCCRI